MHPPASLAGEIWFKKEHLGIAAQTRIQRRAIGNGSRGKRNAYHLITNEAPWDASYLRLHFVKPPGRKAFRFLILDDVVVIRVPPVWGLEQ